MTAKAWEGAADVDLPLDEPYNEKISRPDHTTQQNPSPLKNPQDSATSLGTEDEYVYPEGGLRAWLVVFGSWCAMFASLGIANTLASFQAYIAQNQLSTYTPDQIGWIFSIYTFLSFACGIYIGPLFDVYGPRWLTIPGGVCVVLGMLLLGVCTEYWHFIIVFSVIGGVGTALLFTPSVAAVGHFFYVRRGTATGIATAGGAMGGVVFPLLLESLIPKVGFAWATRIMGFAILFLSLLGILLVKSNLPPSRTARSPHPDLKILRQPAFLFAVIGCFLMEWALFVPLTYIASYALHSGFNMSFSYQILPILSAGSVFGRWLPGAYSDIIGRFNLILLTIVLTIVSVFAIWLPFGTTIPGIVVFAVLFGFSSGSNISLTPVCVGQLCRVEEYGRYYATCYTIVAFGCLTGVPIAGAIVEANGGAYWGLIVFTGACYVGSFVAFYVARGFSGGWKIRMKY
ncbi:related to monocarboxylate transporter 2 [Phialocephala subalpina]|uniref:Related to monocarboxylate transporter 2 n=1 Tax=Phialocephala subalpina TaxID=576137 RepID=A0A1L7WVM2_9HELO|nr:related to monocarboxylate transporter 2 [Phialocephala subalpina]